MSFPQDDNRLSEILDMIGRMAALDFSQPLSTSKNNDMIDAISLGLNMLGEELSANVVEKSKLDVVNSKLEKFAFTTAHDLRSPLNSVTGLLAILELTLDRASNKEAMEYVTRLKTVIEQMKLIVQGILDYSRSAAEMEKQSIDLSTVIHEIMEVDQLSSRATLKVAGELPLVQFNPGLIRQVVRNLLGNAVKYCDKEVCTIVISHMESDGEYCIRVSDNGPGIAPDDHGRIFELFNKVESTRKVDSHGIGLATVKSLLEGAGERIWVESQIGRGATFCFTISKVKLK